MQAKLRVGIVDFLNSRPLAWGFHEGHHSELFQPSFHPPAEVADRLARGALDVGLIPAIEVPRIGDLRVLPDLCVASTHEVRSVILVLGRPIEQVRRVALDLNSRSSAALVRILLSDRYGIEPEYVQAAPELDAMLAQADAALVIGDPALSVDLERHSYLDLAAEWRALVGKPCVFAVWAARRQVDLPGLPGYFEDSLVHGLASLPRIVEQASGELGLAPAVVERYLTRNLSYRLRGEELDSLAEYYRRAHAYGLVPSADALELWAA